MIQPERRGRRYFTYFTATVLYEAQAHSTVLGKDSIPCVPLHHKVKVLCGTQREPTSQVQTYIVLYSSPNYLSFLLIVGFRLMSRPHGPVIHWLFLGLFTWWQVGAAQ